MSKEEIKVVKTLTVINIILILAMVGMTFVDRDIEIGIGDYIRIALLFILAISSIFVFPFILRRLHFSKNLNYKVKIIFAILYAVTGVHLLISLFAATAYHHGITSDACTILPTLAESYYFSIVTFTTLGYGDYSPHEDLILVFALEGLIGYMFFALIMGMMIALLLTETVAIGKATVVRGSSTEHDYDDAILDLEL